MTYPSSPTPLRSPESLHAIPVAGRRQGICVQGVLPALIAPMCNAWLRPRKAALPVGPRATLTRSPSPPPVGLVALPVRGRPRRGHFYSSAVDLAFERLAARGRYARAVIE